MATEGMVVLGRGVGTGWYWGDSGAGTQWVLGRYYECWDIVGVGKCCCWDVHDEVSQRGCWETFQPVQLQFQGEM